MSRWYILDGHNNAVPATLIEGATFIEAHRERRVVGKTTAGKVEVSTVFLGLDHRYGGGPPMLFETLVFGGPMDGEGDRYSTWAEAEAGHKAMVERVRNAV